MPNTTAKQLSDAIKAGATIKTIADQIMIEIAPATSGSFDVGVRERLCILPGYGPLSDPAAHFFVLPDLD